MSGMLFVGSSLQVTLCPPPPAKKVILGSWELVHGQPPFCNASINDRPQDGEGRGYPREIDIQGDFEHTHCPNYLTLRGEVTLGAEN